MGSRFDRVGDGIATGAEWLPGGMGGMIWLAPGDGAGGVGVRRGAVDGGARRRGAITRWILARLVPAPMNG